jgi:hypothetical protein
MADAFKTADDGKMWTAPGPVTYTIEVYGGGGSSGGLASTTKGGNGGATVGGGAYSPSRPQPTVVEGEVFDLVIGQSRTRHAIVNGKLGDIVPLE